MLLTGGIDYPSRVLTLYWKSTSAGGVGFIITILLALPIGRNIGPYAWVIPLVILGASASVVSVSEVLRAREISKFVVTAPQKLKFNGRVLNEQGDLEIVGSTEITNRGKAKMLNLPLLTFASIQRDDAPEKPVLSITPPVGKEMNQLFNYSYKEKTFTVYAWQYQVVDGLAKGEKINYEYKLGNIPGSESGAFTPAGEVFIASPRNRIYQSLEYHLIAPAGYRFEILGLTVKDELGHQNERETRRARRLCYPQIPEGGFGQIMTWNVRSPLPVHDYVCKYRFIKTQGDTVAQPHSKMTDVGDTRSVPNEA